MRIGLRAFRIYTSGLLLFRATWKAEASADGNFALERELELVRRYAGRLLKKYLFETNSPQKFLSPSLYVQYNQCKKSIVYRVVTIMSFLASDF